MPDCTYPRPKRPARSPYGPSTGIRRQRVAVRPDQGSQHGLRPGEVKAMLMLQHDACLICGRPIDERTAVIDHDHALAAAHGHDPARGCRRCVRGLLDSACNSLLGMARDDAAVLRRAAAYVEEARRAHG